jgi:hypothetical protein
MHKYSLSVAILLISTLCCFSQSMSISGTVFDTVAKTPLPYSVAMAVRLKDSMLVAFTRSDVNGHFELNNLQLDTLELIVSNSRFGDQSFYIIGSSNNTSFNVGTIILPPKNKQLKEVVIYAFKDPVYYKGDTLVYAADSFKVKPNATVEDLLKKLPGIKVDQSGKITSQGREIDKVLVDGDEFFGSDPTVATRNLQANGIESVQVFEKKDETNAAGENLQVMNLKLKEDAKKGYFGKVSGGTDFQKFYEGQAMANKFSGTQKISVFAMGGNTPRSSLDWQDINKYGLENENEMVFKEDGFYMPPAETAGIPKTLKSGIYYADKLGKKTKLNMNYTYNSSDLKAYGSSRSQYFLNDSSYTTVTESSNKQKTASHAINMKLVQSLDSLTDLEIEPKLKLSSNNQNNQQAMSFFTKQDSLTHQSDVSNLNDANGYTLNTFVRLTRKFKNLDRRFRMNYNYQITDNASDGILKSLNTGSDSLFKQNINQKKENSVHSQTHNVLLVYTEPLSKKIKLELEYNFNYNDSRQNKTTHDYDNGEYSNLNPLFTNSFENKGMQNSVGARFIYEVKKQALTVGTKARALSFENTNLITQQRFMYSVKNLLPSLSYMLKLGENKRINFRYNTYSNQPSIDQLQPIPDNTNPNQIKLGNMDLKPTFNQSFNLMCNVFKPISGKYVWIHINFTTVDHAFSNSIRYDSLGRTVTKTINVNGNYNSNIAVNNQVNFFNKKIYLEPNVLFGYQNNSNVINDQKNITKTMSISTNPAIGVNLDTLNIRFSYNYTYNVPSSSLNIASNKPYNNQQYSVYAYFKLPYKLAFETAADYNINSNRTPGYNLHYVLWNTTIYKTFLKNENLIVSFYINDLLNQNISATRTVQDNMITDTKTTVINRYFLLQLTYKFNNTHTKDENMY